MRIGHLALTILLAVAFVVSGTMTHYYRNQAIHYRSEWSALLDRLGRRVSGDEKSSPVPAPASAANPSSVVRTGTAASPAQPHTEDPEPGGAVPDESVSSEGEGHQPPIPMQKVRTEAISHQLASVTRKQQALEQAQEAWNRTTNYFSNRNTSGMTGAEQAEYDRMLTLLNETWQLKQSVQGTLRYEERRSATAVIQSNMVALASLLEKERNRQYRDLAAAMGRTGTEAAAFPEYINQIASNTSLQAIFPETALRESASRGSRGGSPFRGRPQRE